ncbi:hypothetical protein [Peribacillus muralis]|nr:hypothetical protein [Peribacillus muralis]
MELKVTFINEPDIELIAEALIELSDRTYKKNYKKEQPLKKAE